MYNNGNKRKAMKILIWDRDFALRDVGGPFGYLYKIHEYLKSNPNDEIVFYSDIFKKDNTNGQSTATEGIGNKSRYTLKRIVSGVRYRLLPRPIRLFYDVIVRWYFKSIKLNDEELVLLNNVDFVHFHQTQDSLQLYKSFRKFKAKTVLTTHMPEPFIDELETVHPELRHCTKYKWFKNLLYKREALAYSVVDHIMFPVPMVQEAYTNNCSILAKSFKTLQDKIFYVPTAIQSTIKIDYTDIEEYRQKLGQYQFKVCFIGRHNVIKGYDKLQEIAKICWEKNPNITFIIGGMEEPLRRIDNKNWVELGWINTYALLENIDLFTLPNKQTFFDLILLEVLRQGVPCVVSETGGNKWFTNRNINGIFGFDYHNAEEAAEIIIELSKKVGCPEWRSMKRSIINEFSNYTLDKYIVKYLSEYKKLL